MEDNSKNMIEDKPPFLGSWNKIYLLVFGELIVLIILFYLFTKAFS
ncbi:MAG TPA: hypothetical protein VF870_02660 [Ignavibacteriaceae bacterium]